MSFVSRTWYTTGDNCRQTTYGPRHGSSNFGSGPFESWYSSCTSVFCPSWNTRYGFSLALSAACLFARLIKFRQASPKTKMQLISCLIRILRCLMFFLHGEYRELYRLGVEVVFQASREMWLMHRCTKLV